jgi:hypothetical protein
MKPYPPTGLVISSSRATSIGGISLKPIPKALKKYYLRSGIFLLSRGSLPFCAGNRYRNKMAITGTTGIFLAGNVAK